MTIKCIKLVTKIPYARKLDQMAIKYYQHLPSKDPTKFTQIGIFGLKINHLATLEPT
jgi:hypothetical protein